MLHSFDGFFRIKGQFGYYPGKHEIMMYELIGTEITA